jgi:hypothetical protein
MEEGANEPTPTSGHMEGVHVTRSLRIRGMHPIIAQKWVFKPYIMILIDI